MPQRRTTGARSETSRADHTELMRAKMELVAARERGERQALPEAVARYPLHADALVDFDAGLLATSAYGDVPLTPESERIALAARSLAFAAVFEPVAMVTRAAPAAFASLKALRQARKLTLAAVAATLGLGVDVLSQLEAGRIRAQSVPERLAQALGEALQTTADQIAALLNGQGSLAPALQRSRTGARKQSGAPEQLDFAEAVRLSMEMDDAAKSAWL